jgi:RimJ/RimL family protein N-acetyltransferase
MKVERFTDARGFHERVGGFLLEHETENCLMIGLVSTLVRDPGYFREPYLAVVGERAVVAAAIMTPPRNLVLSFGAPPGAMPLIAESLHDERPEIPGVLGPAPLSLTFAECWREVGGQDFRRGMAQRIHRLEKVRPVLATSGRLRPATEDDRDLLVEWFAAFDQEALSGPGDLEAEERSVSRYLGAEAYGLWLWEDGEPVSMAGHGGPTPNGMRINAVYTPPHLRGRGYATSCLAALSRHLLEEGRRFCFLFTDLANPTSNNIYRHVGYEPVCDQDEYRFLPVR